MPWGWREAERGLLPVSGTPLLQVHKAAGRAALGEALRTTAAWGPQPAVEQRGVLTFPATQKGGAHRRAQDPRVTRRQGVLGGAWVRGIPLLHTRRRLVLSPAGPQGSVC